MKRTYDPNLDDVYVAKDGTIRWDGEDIGYVGKTEGVAKAMGAWRAEVGNPAEPAKWPRYMSVYATTRKEAVAGVLRIVAAPAAVEHAERELVAPIVHIVEDGPIPLGRVLGGEAYRVHGELGLGRLGPVPEAHVVGGLAPDLLERDQVRVDAHLRTGFSGAVDVLDRAAPLRVPGQGPSLCPTLYSRP